MSKFVVIGGKVVVIRLIGNEVVVTWEDGTTQTYKPGDRFYKYWLMKYDEGQAK